MFLLRHKRWRWDLSSDVPCIDGQELKIDSKLQAINEFFSTFSIFSRAKEAENLPHLSKFSKSLITNFVCVCLCFLWVAGVVQIRRWSLHIISKFAFSKNEKRRTSRKFLVSENEIRCRGVREGVEEGWTEHCPWLKLVSRQGGIVSMKFWVFSYVDAVEKNGTKVVANLSQPPKVSVCMFSFFYDVVSFLLVCVSLRSENYSRLLM